MFSSLKVIELSTVLAGPSVGMFFAELGAEVIKIEHPALPDVTRSWKLPSEAADDPVSAYFSSVNYHKQYRRLDLSSEAGKTTIAQLIRESDVLLLNFKKGDDVKFGLAPEDIAALNPALIVGKITGFGDDSDRVAYDLILQAESGFMAMNGTPESGPVKMPVAMIDVLAAHQLKEGLLVALLERQQSATQPRPPRGKTVSVSLYDAAVSSLVNQASNYLMEGHVPQRIGSLHPNIAPYGEIFRTADGKLITFAIGSNRHFEKLCAFLQLNELSSDVRFSHNQARVQNRTALFGLLNEAIAKQHAAELDRRMQQEHIPMGRIRSLDEVFSEPAAQELVREEQIAGKSTKRVTSIAFRTYEH
jgi:crotonobetainyl-CoA:carnitine CoA-transferase CaiB-like acyl-CoA transferase